MIELRGSEGAQTLAVAGSIFSLGLTYSAWLRLEQQELASKDGKMEFLD